ncbi:glycosyltransferase [Nonlabens xiamenensis]|uniref:glycosyltransferase n=1 Tax=Nonlabens xiamenensis TaxID=2341043 RepID=UPI000F60A2E5|nr:glycosyltransferase [Nonlabens xiamenensis]
MEIGIEYYILGSFALINIAYYLALSKAGFMEPVEPSGNTTDPCSVIVCSKNEVENLKNLVPQLLRQDHPNFEIILINDASVDGTGDLIEQFKQTDQRVKMVNVVNNENFWANKKYALTLGIKKAVNDKLIFIDADCNPASDSWLRLMAQQLSEHKSIVLGYGGYHQIKGSILNSLIRFETVFAAVQYFSFAALGNPYMGVGRNLGFTAKEFYDNRGYMSHMKVMGGDDDLFVNEAGNSKNTSLVLNPEGFTYSLPKTSWSSWWKQKKRHISTSSFYKKKDQLLLGLFFFSQCGFIISAIVALFLAPSILAVLGIIVLRYTIFWIVLGRGMYRFRESDLTPWLPLLEIVLVLSQLLLFVSNMAHRPKQWN